MVALPVAAGIRLVWGPLTWADAVVAAAIVLAQPFTEWLIHVYVLHVRPRGRITGAIDWAAGRSHRLHHKDPADLSWQFIHPHAVLGGFVLDAVLLAASPLGATGALTAITLTLLYEWTHFLIHTDVRPRNRVYKKLWRHHRLHHFRNENYWFGVTGRFGDLVLRTLPDKNAVPVSPTARTATAARTTT
jgi:sterol desaturase/sphingolipid hydroxylase (fatty acid hydroxylase superfamily)